MRMFPTKFISKCRVSLRIWNTDCLFLYVFPVVHREQKKAKLQSLCQVFKIIIFFLESAVNLIYKNRVLDSRNDRNHHLKKNSTIPIRIINVFPITVFRQIPVSLKVKPWKIWEFKGMKDKAYLLLRVEIHSFSLMEKEVPEQLIESELCFKFMFLFKYQEQNLMLSKS